MKDIALYFKERDLVIGTWQMGNKMNYRIEVRE